MSPWQTASALDRRISQRLRIPDRRRGLRLAALAIAHLGDSPLWVVILLALYVWGGASLRAPVIRAAAAVLTAGVVGGLIKRVVRRPRPDGYAPGLYSRSLDHYSFPSGHAARVAAVAVAAGAAYPDVAAAAALLALGVAAARVALGVHYVGDAMAGLALGAIVAFLWGGPWQGLPY